VVAVGVALGVFLGGTMLLLASMLMKRYRLLTFIMQDDSCVAVYLLLTLLATHLCPVVDEEWIRPGARFTKYLTTILRLSYDNAKVTMDLLRMSNLQNNLRRAQGFS